MDWSYLAGFFDGEGCICIRYGQHSRVTFQITNTDEEVLGKIKDFLAKNNFSSKIYRKKIPCQKDRFDLIISNHIVVEPLLRKLSPLLVVKRGKAEEAIELVKTKVWHNNGINHRYDENRESIVGDYLKGFSSNMLEKKYGINKTTIWRRLKKDGISRTMKEAVRLSFLRGRRSKYWGKNALLRLKYGKKEAER